MHARCADAVAGFLAEAVALLSRKPQEFHEAERAILSPQTSTGNAMRHGQHSLLVVAALRQAVRVAASAKMPADARAAIACYVAGEMTIGSPIDVPLLYCNQVPEVLSPYTQKFFYLFLCCVRSLSVVLETYQRLHRIPLQHFM